MKLPWVPKLGPKMRKEFKKFGMKIIFTSKRNLKKSVSRNKSNLLSNSFPDVYQLDSTYNAYILAKLKERHH